MKKRIGMAVYFINFVLFICLIGCSTRTSEPDALSASNEAPEVRRTGSNKIYNEQRVPEKRIEFVEKSQSISEIDRMAGNGAVQQISTESAVSLSRPKESRNAIIFEFASTKFDLATTIGGIKKKSRLVNLFPDEELWIIARSPDKTKSKGDPNRDDNPGCGSLMAKVSSAPKKIPVPLKHTDVQGQVSGYIATVDVTQKFHNPFNEKIEAVYVFPLPQNAAVNEFVMTIGERRIRGVIRERQEAEQIYMDARRKGKVASLLIQERPNIFTQSVANIEPGKEIDIHIKYFHTLAYVDGSYEFVFPMVVGPRFNPPHTTDGVGAVGVGMQGASGQKTEVSYLRPNERSGHDIAVSLEIDAGVAIEKVSSSSHVIQVKSQAQNKSTVSLSPADRIPNRDFILRYKVAGKSIKANLLTYRDKRGGFFTLMLYPPEDQATLDRRPMEMIFVLDCSGSMSGLPIAKAKMAIERALKRLNEEDTFQIIRFSSNSSRLGPAPVVGTPVNIQRGLDYLTSLESGGGTMMIEGIKAALDFPHDPDRLRVVSFMTDGYIGNEMEIFGEVQQRLGSSRIFSFGIGSSVNRYLIEGLARLGRGAVAYVGLDDSGGEAVDKFYESVRHAALTDLKLDWGSMKVREVYPTRIPDLFAGRPVILTGRFDGDVPTLVQASARAAEKNIDFTILANSEKAQNTHSGIPSVWARKQIAILRDRALREPGGEIYQSIKNVALEYSLLSSQTAFIAVDSTSQTQGDHGTTVPVAVPVPAGVKYSTSVRAGK